MKHSRLLDPASTSIGNSRDIVILKRDGLRLDMDRYFK